jgi:NitT/TauT family transport system permease protein
MKMLSRINATVLHSVGLIAFFIIWEMAPRFGLVDAQFLPPLSSVLLSIKELWDLGLLYTHVVVSLWRVLLGLLLAAFIALPLGFVLEVIFPKVSRQLETLFRLLSHVNPFSLAPLFMLMFGLGEKEKLAIISLVALWPILFHTITGIRCVDPLLIKTAKSLNVSTFCLIKDILFPGALPTIFTGMRIGVQMAVFMLIAAEMLGAGAGLGWLVHNSAMMYQIPRMYAAGMLIILIGIGLNQVLLWLQKYSWFWQPFTESFGQKASLKTVRPLNSTAGFAAALLLGVIIFLGGQEVKRVNLQGSAPGMNHHLQHNMDAKTPPTGQEQVQSQAQTKDYIPTFKATEDQAKRR